MSCKLIQGAKLQGYEGPVTAAIVAKNVETLRMALDRDDVRVNLERRVRNPLPILILTSAMFSKTLPLRAQTPHPAQPHASPLPAPRRTAPYPYRWPPAPRAILRFLVQAQ